MIRPAPSWQLLRYFTPKEFDSPDAPGSGAAMNTEFVWILDEIRANISVPLIVNSGFRTVLHNAKVGGTPASAHLVGLAADIRPRQWSDEIRAKIIFTAAALGIRRIGIAKSYIHLDASERNPRPRIWLYE